MHTILFCFVLLWLHNQLHALHINDLLIVFRISSLTLRASYNHYSDVIMATMASQITSITIVHTTVYSGADQRKRQNSASLALVWGIHRWPANSPHKLPVTQKMFPFDDVFMWLPNETFFCHIGQYLTTTKRIRSNIPRYTIQNRNVYISVLNCVLWDMGQVHCGICETALFLERTTWTYPGTDVVLLLLVSAWILVRFPLLFTFIPQESRLPSYDWDF